MKLTMIAVTCLLSILGAFVPNASALTPEEKCAVAKLKAVARRVTGTVNCRVKALKKGKPVDPACLAKVETTYQKAMAGAEKSATCADGAEQLEALVVQFVGEAAGQTIGKTVFITSTTHTGNLGGLAGADAICQARADEAGLGGTFRAWLSDAGTSARDRLTHAAVPYVLVDGTRVASNWEDLVDGSLDHRIDLTEIGATVDNPYAWTSTTPSGDKFSVSLCASWNTTQGSLYGGRGLATAVDGRWTNFSLMTCGVASRLYCFQQ